MKRKENQIGLWQVKVEEIGQNFQFMLTIW